MDARAVRCRALFGLVSGRVGVRSGHVCLCDGRERPSGSLARRSRPQSEPRPCPISRRRTTRLTPTRSDVTDPSELPNRRPHRALCGTALDGVLSGRVQVRSPFRRQRRRLLFTRVTLWTKSVSTAALRTQSKSLTLRGPAKLAFACRLRQRGVRGQVRKVSLRLSLIPETSVARSLTPARHRDYLLARVFAL